MMLWSLIAPQIMAVILARALKNPVEIKKYTHLFDLIDAHSHRLLPKNSVTIAAN